MNIAVIVGVLVGNAVVRGKKTRALVFTVVTQQPNGETEGLVSHVPCVVFNPPPEMEKLLTTDGKDKHVELQGRISSSRFEANGEPRSNAEVIVFTKTLKLGS